MSSIIEELRDTAAATVDAVVSDLPAGFPQEIADSIGNGIKRRVPLLDK